MIAEISAALASLNTIREIAQNASSARDQANINEAVTDIQARLIEAQNGVIESQAEQTRLAARVEELEQECMRLEDWSREAESYRLHEIARGIFAYIHQNSEQPMESAHKLCSNCFNQGTKSILQQQRVAEGRQLRVKCHRCGSDMIFRHYIDVV